MNKLIKEIRDWHFFLNVQVSIIIVSAGMWIQTLPKEDQAGKVLLLMIFLAAFTHSSKKFPDTIKLLRKHKKTLSLKQSYMYAGIMKQDFGIKASFTKLIAFTMSCFYIGYIYFNSLA